MSLGKLKIRDEVGRVTECSLDGHDLTRHLTAIRFKAEVNEITRVTLEMVVEVDYDGEPRLTIEATDPIPTVDRASALCGLPHPDVKDASCTRAAGHRGRHGNGVTLWWKPTLDEEPRLTIEATDLERPCDACHQLPCICLVG